MIWFPQLLVSVYVFGFTVTCQWMARDTEDVARNGMIGPICGGLVWPLLAGTCVFVGFLWLIGGGPFIRDSDT